MIPYKYKAVMVRVVDGDTIDLKIDLGFYLSASLRFRLLGVDTPELNSRSADERIEAQTAKAFVEEKTKGDLIVETFKADSFGRWLARVFYRDEQGVLVDLSEELIRLGYGKPYGI